MAEKKVRERRRRLSSTVEVSRVYDGETYVRVNSVGTGGTRPVLLVPGIGVSSTDFEKLAPHPNEFGPVHAVDLPGFGGVPHPDDALSIRQFADLVGRVIDEMKLDDPVEKRLPLIKAHTLVTLGEFDSVAPRDWAKEVGELLPSSRLWEITGAAHSVMYAHAEEVAKLCVEHARETAGDADGDNSIHIMDDAPEGDPAEAPTLTEVATAIGGRVIETAGILQDDDKKIAEGKSIAAAAIDD